MEEGTETVVAKNGERIQVGAKMLVVNDEGRYLILKRDPAKYPEAPEKWEIPGGRWQPTREKVSGTLQRELLEETGLELLGKSKFIAKQKFPHGYKKDITVVRLTYITKATGTVKLSDEHGEYRWASVEELENTENLDPYVRDLLDRGLIK